ncbi:hypothetical protein [Dietzia psychralcaliphila]|uniref:hypothetical protein n=1 Tax=Dietzia psychralcaliphila TaxID=139021 RepID=UPI001C1E2F0F|nr:hypothetical protein [Dietzia psychralcaliphila]
MQTRVLLAAGAIALVAASCAQPEPQVLSEAPRSASATELTSSAEPTERESQPGRFIARCATEADGGTPGMTFFTDGSQSVTDHCLSRYYIGVQPAPGALYVADEDAGTWAPSRAPQASTTTTTNQWTPAQPRTDIGVQDPWLDGDDLDADEPTEGDAGESEPGDGEPGDGTTEETTPVTPPEGTTPPTAPPTTPGGTEPTTPGDVETTSPGEVEQSTPGSAEPAPPTMPTTVPTGTGTPEPDLSAPPTSALPPFGWTGSHGPAGSHGSERLPALPWPTPSLSGGATR